MTSTESRVSQVALKLLSKLFPSKLTPAEQAELAVVLQRYWKWNLGLLVPYFSFAGAIGYGSYEWLMYLAARGTDRWPEAVYVLRPTGTAFALPAIFFGMILSAVPVSLLLRLLLGRERYREFSRASRYQHGGDGQKMGAALVVIVGGAAVFLAAQLLGTYTAAYGDRLVVRTLWHLSGPQTFRFADVAEVLEVEQFTALNGRVQHRPHHVVRFTDGNEWRTRDFGNGRDPDPFEDGPMIRYIAQRSERPVQRRTSL